MLELMRSLFIFALFSAAFAGFSWAAEGPGGGGEPGKEAEPAKEAEQPPENPPEIGGDELQGEGRGSNTEGWDQYVDFIEGSIKYLPPSEAGGSQGWCGSGKLIQQKNGASASSERSQVIVRSATQSVW